MNTYYCYELWNYLEPDVSEKRFESDKEAFDYWIGLRKKLQADACFSITRLFEVKGVFYEDFICMIKCCKNGFQVVKSHVL